MIGGLCSCSSRRDWSTEGRGLARDRQASRTAGEEANLRARCRVELACAERCIALHRAASRGHRTAFTIGAGDWSGALLATMSLYRPLLYFVQFLLEAVAPAMCASTPARGSTAASEEA